MEVKNRGVILNKISMQKCGQCNEPLRFNEKSIRYENDWFHIGCFIAKTKKSKEKKKTKLVLILKKCQRSLQRKKRFIQACICDFDSSKFFY